MAKASRFEQLVEPDLTPMIDCVFQLLIFFMVTTAFVTTKGLSVDLPSSSQEREESPGKDVNIVVEEDGSIEVNGVKVASAEVNGAKVADMEDMAKQIKRAMQAEITKNAVLQVHPRILHKTVIRIMDVARGEGIEAIAFASEETAAPATEAE